MSSQDLEVSAYDEADMKSLTNRKWWTLFVLTFVAIFNFIDRQILYILIEPIRLDLEMSDTQVGLLTGLSFAVVYGIAGLWVARLADRYPRNMIIAASVFVWSAATALGGLAGSYWQLALSRLGVAAGESGSTPASHSLIADLFPLERRAVAMAVFAAGTPVGVMIGYAGGGWMASALTWREVLLWVGVPGMLLSVLVLTTIKEPRPRRMQSTNSASGAVAALLKLPIFRHMMMAAGLFAASAYAFSAFQPSFLIRLHGFSSAQAGLALGLVHGIAGAIGIVLGGYLADRLGKLDARWRQWVPAIGAAISAPFTVAALFAGSGELSALLMAGSTIGGLIYAAPTFGLVQSIAPVWARATASALILLAISLIGQSCGPLLVGLVSDVLRASHGDEALRWALLIVPVLQSWSALHFWIAGKKIPEAAISG